MRRHGLAPRVPLFAEIGGQPRRGVVESIADRLRLGGLDRAVAALRRTPRPVPREVVTLDLRQLRVSHRRGDVRLQCGEMDPDYRLGMIEGKDRRHARTEVIAAGAVAG